MSISRSSVELCLALVYIPDVYVMFCPFIVLVCFFLVLRFLSSLFILFKLTWFLVSVPLLIALMMVKRIVFDLQPSCFLFVAGNLKVSISMLSGLLHYLFPKRLQLVNLVLACSCCPSAQAMLGF